jgi:hypothetical protein
MAKKLTGRVWSLPKQDHRGSMTTPWRTHFIPSGYSRTGNPSCTKSSTNIEWMINCDRQFFHDHRCNRCRKFVAHPGDSEFVSVQEIIRSDRRYQGMREWNGIDLWMNLKSLERSHPNFLSVEDHSLLPCCHKLQVDSNEYRSSFARQVPIKKQQRNQNNVEPKCETCMYTTEVICIIRASLLLMEKGDMLA